MRREWVTLSSIFTCAVRTGGVLEINPFMLVSKPLEEEARNIRISDGDIDKVKQIFSYDGVQPPRTLKQHTAWAFLFALETACRLGEITKLEPQDVHDDLIHLRDTKNGGDRYVPLSDEAKRLLRLDKHTIITKIANKRIHLIALTPPTPPILLIMVVVKAYKYQRLV